MATVRDARTLAPRHAGLAPLAGLVILTALLAAGVPAMTAASVAATSAASVAATTDADFDAQVVASPTPVMVAVTAAWCRPCRTLEPALRAVADEAGDGLAVVTLNADANPQTPARFDVSTLPTVLVFRDGQVVGRAIGPRSRAQLLDLAANPILSSPSRATPLDLTDARFRNDVLESATPTLVAFTASWCGPCRRMAPDLERLAADTTGLLTVARLDVDEQPHLPAVLAITAIPSAVLFNSCLD